MKFDSWLNILKDGIGKSKLTHKIVRESLDIFRIFVTPETKTYEVIYLREVQQLEWSAIDEKVEGLTAGESQNIHRSVQEILADIIVSCLMDEYEMPQKALIDDDGDCELDDIITLIIKETMKSLDTREKLNYKPRTQKTKPRKKQPNNVPLF